MQASVEERATINTTEQSENTVTLFRPVGPAELRLIVESGWRRFPPRLPEQPIFYPVENEEYARQIARDWNVKSSGEGHVLRFRVDAAFIVHYPVGLIELIASYP